MQIYFIHSCIKYSSESYGNRLFAHNRYDSLTDAENADDWLKFQLKKLKAKRENNPEILRRKRQEKLLLEVDIPEKFIRIYHFESVV